MATRSRGSSLEISGRTATLLQPGWYGTVRSRTSDVTTAQYSASVSHAPLRDGTHQDSHKPTRSWSRSAVRVRSSALYFCFDLQAKHRTKEKARHSRWAELHQPYTNLLKKMCCP